VARSDGDARFALVTGGGQGIGRAVVLHLRALGWTVAALDIDAQALAELPPDVARLTLDVAAADAGERLARFLEPWTDRLHCLVNNAGVGTRAGTLSAPDLAAFDRVLAVNLRAPYAVTAACLPWLRQAGGASVVNIASTRAIMSEPDTEAYAASKGGLVALTHAMAVSLGPAVRVNAVSPGWIATEAWQKASRRRDPALRPEDHAQHPAGRVGLPEDVAGAVAFLADEGSGFVTGAHLVVDGGMTRKMIYIED